jgi:transcriptional regulator with XRE-family HTH domain
MKRPRPFTGTKYDRGERPRETTLLKIWLEKRDKSAFEFAKRLQVDPKTVLALCNGEQLPGYITAFKIADATEGGVPAESWLGTELGRLRWAETTFDWNEWLEQKRTATAKHDEKRRKAGSRQ